jgi:aspartate ammonia-lyase
MPSRYRMEKDALGPLKIPADAYWGVNTGRALENFAVSGRPVHPRLIAAYA